MVTPSRSLQSLVRATLSNQEIITSSPPLVKTIRSPPTTRLAFSSPETSHSPVNSSQSSSPSSSTPNSPAGTVSSSTIQYQRPSTLHGLKHKLHTAAKSIHSPNRRKSVGHIPLSPLARTPSPSPLPSSPTRSPSPLAFPAGHQPGSSNTTQSYSPGSSLSTPGSGTKKGFGRPKSGEPGSPLLRRALSPDRLHPRSAETKGKSASSSISPLCNPVALKVTVSTAPRVTITSQSPPLNRTNLEQTESMLISKPPEHPLLSRRDQDKNQIFPESFQRRERKHINPINTNENVSFSPADEACAEYLKISANSVSVVSSDRTSQHLPRIAEEKDSPTGSSHDVISPLKEKSKESHETNNSGKLLQNQNITRNQFFEFKNNLKIHSNQNHSNYSTATSGELMKQSESTSKKSKMDKKSDKEKKEDFVLDNKNKWAEEKKRNKTPE